jgi:hypothetical protein
MKSWVAPVSNRMTIWWPLREGTYEDWFSLGNVWHRDIVYLAGLGSNNSQWMVGVTLQSRRVTLPRCHTLLGEIANVTTIVACAWDHTHLLWWWVQHGRWGAIALGTIFWGGGGQTANWWWCCCGGWRCRAHTIWYSWGALPEGLPKPSSSCFPNEHGWRHPQRWCCSLIPEWSSQCWAQDAPEA